MYMSQNPSRTLWQNESTRHTTYLDIEDVVLLCLATLYEHLPQCIQAILAQTISQ